MKQTALLVFLVFALTITAKSQSVEQDFLTRVEVTQRSLLSRLTGKKPYTIKIERGETAQRRGTIVTGRIMDRYGLNGGYRTRQVLANSLGNIGLPASFHKYKTKAEGENVFTVIRATNNSSEYVVLGAHFDSVKGSPGANDNASGTALVFAVAEELVKLKHRSRNVIVVFFDQEELGLIGSRAFAAELKKDRKMIHSVHTIDQMGWDADGDRAIELELPTPDLEKLYRSEAKKLAIPVHKTNVPSTDHTAFREVGFDAIGITEEYKNRDTTPHYHKPTDTYETIDFAYLASTTRLVYRVMRNILTDD